jgi:hypothetical protein
VRAFAPPNVPTDSAVDVALPGCPVLVFWPIAVARGPARRCVAAQRSRAGDRRRSGGSRDRLRLGPTHCHPCAPRVSDRPVSVSGSRLPKSLRRTSQCWLSRPSGAAARCGAVASSTPVPSPGRDNSKVSPRCPLPRRRPGTGGGPAALGPWDSCQDRILRPAEPGWPVRRERGRHRPVQPVLFARHPREYARSRLLDPVPIGERRARLGLGRRPRLTDLAEDVPVADQLPVVTPHFRPPGARRLGGLKGQSRPPAGRYTKMRGARPNARTDATRASSGKWDRRRPRAPPPLVTTTGAIVLVSVGKPATSAWARRRTT